MERLTPKDWKDIKRHCHAKGIHLSNQFTEEECDKMIERLAELEDRLESGELLELPCKVGDEVYVVDKFLKYQVCEGVIETVKFNKYTNPQIWIKYRYHLHGIGDCTKESRIDLLENVFFNKAAAAARLKELQEQEK